MKQLAVFLLAGLSLQGVLAQTLTQDINSLQIRVGRPLITLGPTGPAANGQSTAYLPMPGTSYWGMDQFFNTTQLTSGAYRGYTANSATARLDGATPWSTGIYSNTGGYGSNPVTKPGAAICGTSTTKPCVPGQQSTASFSSTSPVAWQTNGLWVEDVIVDHSNANHWYGVVHAETTCPYNTQASTGQLSTVYGNAHNKSMILMESFDQGMDWSTVAGGTTPAIDGQIIANNDCHAGMTPTGTQTGEGDCTVITDLPGASPGYHYLYCTKASNYQMIVARAPYGQPQPGNWAKYNAASGWSQPAVGGTPTPLVMLNSSGNATTNAVPGASVSKWSEKNYVMSVTGSSPAADPSLPPDANGNPQLCANTASPSAFPTCANPTNNVFLSFSSDRVTFEALTDPLLMTDGTGWGRTPATSNSASTIPSTELIAYPSIIGTTGGRTWSGGQMLLTYSYYAPNDSQNYLVFRNVSISTNGTGQNSQVPQVGVELSRWTQTVNGVSQIWTTTAAIPGNFTSTGFNYSQRMGYVMTQPLTGPGAAATTELEECADGWQGGGLIDHTVTNFGLCKTSKLRNIGYVYTSAQANTVPLYLCWSPTVYHSHFVSNQSNCEGAGTMQWLLGYALAN